MRGVPLRHVCTDQRLWPGLVSPSCPTWVFILVLMGSCYSPIVPGHEIIGRVVEVGEGVEEWKTGDRVGGGWHGGHDGESRRSSVFSLMVCSFLGCMISLTLNTLESYRYMSGM